MRALLLLLALAVCGGCNIKEGDDGERQPVGLNSTRCVDECPGLGESVASTCAQAESSLNGCLDNESFGSGSPCDFRCVECLIDASESCR